MEYENGHRTKNPDYDPPYLKLKEFRGKTAEFNDPSKLLQNFMKQEEKKIKYIKPQLNITIKKSEEDLNLK